MYGSGLKIMASVELNTPAPGFSLEDYDGKTVMLSDFKGKTNVVLVFNRGFT
jgi:peroxiredoxin